MMLGAIAIMIFGIGLIAVVGLVLLLIIHGDHK